jgi:SAM-dependent methyltransferase
MNPTGGGPELDDVAAFARERWNALSRRGIAYGRPWTDLTRAIALQRVDPEGMLRGWDLPGRTVLCLAGGGGQQSAAFALLGAAVTVLDLSEVQLAKDHEACTHHGVSVRLVQGDMRSLAPFEAGSFDLVWHAHSLNFVPDPRPVFDEVARVLRPDGLYRLSYSNPFFHGMLRDGAPPYSVRLPYQDGAEVTFVEPDWDFTDGDGVRQRVAGPREFRHTLGAVINGLAARGIALTGLWEDTGPADAAPGTWEYSQRVAPQFLTLWFRRA